MGSGLNTLLQMGIALYGISLPPEAAVTLVLAVIPLLVGTAALRISQKKGPIPALGRVELILLGLAGFISWSGFLAGPLLICISALVPEK